MAICNYNISSHINIIGKLTNSNNPEANVLDTIMYHSIEPNESDLLNFSYRGLNLEFRY